MEVKEYGKQVLRNIQNKIKVAKLNTNRHIDIGSCTKARFATVAPYVRVGAFCNIQGVEIGAYTYLDDYCELPQTKIGKFCSVAKHVILAAGNHPINYLSTSPYTYSKMRWSLSNENFYSKEFYYVSPGSRFLCEIGNDVWIGTGALLVCGKDALHIGDGAVIAAGAVVTRDVPPYAIVAGCPAKIIRYRFDEQTISRLLDIKWWDRDIQWIGENCAQFSTPKKFIAEITAKKA